jgi:hypothetical protein
VLVRCHLTKTHRCSSKPLYVNVFSCCCPDCSQEPGGAAALVHRTVEQLLRDKLAVKGRGMLVSRLAYREVQQAGQDMTNRTV